MSLVLEKLCCGYQGVPVIRDVSFAVEPGQVVCILGPNGVGKTTLFKTVLGFLPPLSGQVVLDGRPLCAWPRRQLARRVAYVPQAQGQPFPYPVEDMVLMGRASYLGRLSSPGAKDRAVCGRVLEQLGISCLKDKPYTKISGGERQLVLIARALAQEPAYLMMDEPTSSLDFGNQAQVLKRILALAGEGIGVLMITHAPQQALSCGGEAALLLDRGRSLVGPAAQVLTEASLAAAYGVPVRLLRVQEEPDAASYACIPVLR